MKDSSKTQDISHDLYATRLQKLETLRKEVGAGIDPSNFVSRKDSLADQRRLEADQEFAREQQRKRLEAEARAEEEHVTALTMKYSHMEDEDEILDITGTPRASAAGQSERTPQHRAAQIEADLLEISRVIESKEELISQLQCSQAKYSVSHI